MDSSFTAVEPRWFTRNRTYQVYVTPQALCGGYVAGQISDEETAKLHFQSLSLFFKAYIKGLLRRKSERESLYDSLDPTTPEFLAAHNFNFQIPTSEIIGIRINRNRSIWTPRNSGTVKIELRTGKIRKLILIGDQTADDIFELLQPLHPDTTILGKLRSSQVRIAGSLESSVLHCYHRQTRSSGTDSSRSSKHGQHRDHRHRFHGLHAFRGGSRFAERANQRDRNPQ